MVLFLCLFSNLLVPRIKPRIKLAGITEGAMFKQAKRQSLHPNHKGAGTCCRVQEQKQHKPFLVFTESKILQRRKTSPSVNLLFLVKAL